MVRGCGRVVSRVRTKSFGGGAKRGRGTKARSEVPNVATRGR